VTCGFSPSGFPATLAEPAGDHHPVALAEGVGQGFGLAAPDVDLEVGGVAVAPLAVLLDPLGHAHPKVCQRDAVVGEAQFGVLDQVADNGGVNVRCHDDVLGRLELAIRTVVNEAVVVTATVAG
jgi:hypothetical protein